MAREQKCNVCGSPATVKTDGGYYVFIECPRCGDLTVAVGAPAVYDKDGHKLRAEVGRNIAAGIYWAKTRYKSAPPSSTMSAAPPGGIKRDVKRIMRDEIPLQQHAHDLSHSRLEPERCAQAAGQASIDANQLFQLLDTIAKAVSF